MTGAAGATMSARKLLTCEALTIGYDQGKPGRLELVHGIAADIFAGQLVGLLGPNGVGKSTLLRTLSGLHKPMQGRVLLEGRDLAGIDVRERAKSIAVVLTEAAHSARLSVFELVALGRHPHTNWSGKLQARDLEAVHAALASTRSERLIERQVAQLSDGERQRVMIARALAQEPKVLILDEPTAFLDLPRRIEIMRLLQGYARGSERAVILATHDLELALSAADRIWLLSADSRFSNSIPEEHVLSGRIERLFGDQSGFDAERGVFRMINVGKDAVCLEGEGIAALWTARALERIGYNVMREQSEPCCRVSVRSESGATRWTVEQGGRITECRALGEVVTLLRHDCK